MVRFILCMRFFRAPRGKTAYQQNKVPLCRRQKANRVSRVIKNQMNPRSPLKPHSVVFMHPWCVYCPDAAFLAFDQISTTTISSHHCMVIEYPSAEDDRL